MPGRVYLVGAGPGDPELLTRKAWRVLQSADVVLHDDLVSEEILRVLPRAAQVVNVGKRCGAAAPKSLSYRRNSATGTIHRRSPGSWTDRTGRRR